MSGDPVSIPQADAELHPVIERITGHSVDIELLFWPITGPSFCATMRAATSDELPGWKPTMMRSGFCG